MSLKRLKMDKQKSRKYTVVDVSGKEWEVRLGIDLPQDRITVNVDFNNHPAWGNRTEDYSVTSDTSYYVRYKNLKIGKTKLDNVEQE